ncbi:MAG: hypothetical protein FJZ47_23780 [Candidatus Tectomicrobia bacterium]|uniref:Uncharacterized protein n=1 Tax=Tectimicrobiota bacterium TaxID=2528274 RepID=A0A937W874_UNCTE|nr:hypothetical protein [Candidatus Tectomicrobia bacterium]
MPQVDSQRLRLVSVPDAGYHPSDSDHRGLKTMPDPRRPWDTLAWRRIVDDSHACPYLPQWADGLCGPGPESPQGAQRMRPQLQTQANGVAQVFHSVSA